VDATDSTQLRLIHPQEGDREPKLFTYDHCFHSHSPSTSNGNGLPHHDQPQIFDRIGVEVVESAFAGYNACVFAYGQTGEFLK